MDLLETASRYFICTQDNFKVDGNQVNFALQTARHCVLICGSNNVYRGLVTINGQIVYSISSESRMNFNAACFLMYAYLKSLDRSIKATLTTSFNCVMSLDRNV
jgi:hypothetical protein